MDKPEPSHTEADILRVITELLQPTEGKRGMTTAEITTKLGASKERVREMLGQLHREGRLMREDVWVESYDGSRRKVKAYLIKPGDSE